jgi:hypothetical protein
MDGPCGSCGEKFRAKYIYDLIVGKSTRRRRRRRRRRREGSLGYESIGAAIVGGEGEDRVDSNTGALIAASTIGAGAGGIVVAAADVSSGTTGGGTVPGTTTG